MALTRCYYAGTFVVLSAILVFLVSQEKGETFFAWSPMVASALDTQMHDIHQVQSITSDKQMNVRRDNVREICRKLRQGPKFKGLIAKSERQRRPITYIREYNISYCHVGKSGSTFLKQIFAILTNGEEKANKLEAQSRRKTHMWSKELLVPYSSQEWRQSKLVLAARNPYTRLLSAYIDRVSIPSITAPVREGSRCKLDVTFNEFLGIVVRNTKNRKFDTHWSPMFYMCPPCEMTPSIVIKQESLIDDIKYTLNHLNITEDTKRAIERKTGETRASWAVTITGIVKAVMVTGDRTFLKQGCVGWFGAIKSLWRAFQVQGYIDDSIEIPVNLYNQTADFSNVNLFLETVLSTIERNPLSKEARSLQRRKALAKAYADVDSSVIEQIKEVFRFDFEMFGYSKEPPLFKVVTSL